MIVWAKVVDIETSSLGSRELVILIRSQLTDIWVLRLPIDISCHEAIEDLFKKCRIVGFGYYRNEIEKRAIINGSNTEESGQVNVGPVASSSVYYATRQDRAKSRIILSTAGNCWHCKQPQDMLQIHAITGCVEDGTQDKDTKFSCIVPNCNTAMPTVNDLLFHWTDMHINTHVWSTVCNEPRDMIKAIRNAMSRK